MTLTQELKQLYFELSVQQSDGPLMTGLKYAIWLFAILVAWEVLKIVARKVWVFVAGRKV